MSKTKGGGSTRNGRDSQSKRLGVKRFDGEAVTGEGAGDRLYVLQTRNEKFSISFAGF